MKKVFVLVLAILLLDSAIILIGAVEIIRNPLMRKRLAKYGIVTPYDLPGEPINKNDR